MLEVGGKQGSYPKGVDDLYVRTYRGFGPQGWDLGLLAEILNWRLRFGLQDYNISLQARI